MDPRQTEDEVEALEQRLERLRALYEQYFMGMEKMEPGTLRGEIDRKFWEMRKRRIQNTGLRFRLQMLVQRYNTYQQYWARVTREMERGTYMRDIIRVAKRIGSQDAMTIAGKKRAKMFQQLADAQEGRLARRRGDEAGKSIPASGAPPEASEQAAEPESAEPSALTKPAAQRPHAAAPGPGSDFEDPTAWNLFDDGPVSPAPAAATEGLVVPPSQNVGAVLVAAATRSAPPKIRRPEEDDVATLPPPPGGVEVWASIPAAPGLPKNLADASSAASGPAPAGKRPPPPPKKAAAAHAGPPKPGPRPGPEPAGGAGDARERSMRQVYDQYVAAKRKANEPTEGLTYEKLRRSLERQAENLRVSHGDRKVDFEVVSLNGRTMIRPVVR